MATQNSFHLPVFLSECSTKPWFSIYSVKRFHNIEAEKASGSGGGGGGSGGEGSGSTTSNLDIQERIWREGIQGKMILERLQKPRIWGEVHERPLVSPNN